MTKRILPGLPGAPIPTSDVFKPASQAFSLSSTTLPGKPDESFLMGGRLIHSLKDGDKVPVGFNYQADGTLSVASEAFCDFSRCMPMFAPMNRLAADLTPEAMRQHIVPGLNAHLVRDMVAFYGIAMVMNKDAAKRKAEREAIYARSTFVPLSQIARAGLAVCAELTALGKYWLDGRGHNAMILNHAFRFAHIDESTSLHAMIAVYQPAGVLLFDPTNTMGVKGDVFPGMVNPRDGQCAAPGLYLIKRAAWDALLKAGKNAPALLALDNGSAWLNPAKRETAYAGFAPLSAMNEPEKLLIPATQPASKGPDTPKA